MAGGYKVVPLYGQFSARKKWFYKINGLLEGGGFIFFVISVYNVNSKATYLKAFKIFI